MATTPASSFPKFLKLPVEIQIEIWKLVPYPTIPEVCSLSPAHIIQYGRLSLRPPDHVHPGPLTVDTAWPALLHVCRASREVALKSPHLHLRYNPAAGIKVPFRNFDPVIDTLYWSKHNWEAIYQFVGENTDLIGQIRHMAFDLTVAFVRGGGSFSGKALSLQSISVVLPDSHSTSHNINGIITAPTRRCRLVDVPDDVVDRISVTNCKQHETVGVSEGEDTQQLRLYMNTRRKQDLYDYPAQLVMLEQRCGCSRNQPMRPTPDWSKVLEWELKAQTFVEYRWDEAKGKEAWVEVCKDSVFIPEPRRGSICLSDFFF